ncbi:MAG: efflux RND transporter periplasmic adaptor subunit [Rhodocyclaceae bacterium]|nr:efflux RND transporter periplasmic adaptor subunit [Rhodocyclaceae bacterium]
MKKPVIGALVLAAGIAAYVVLTDSQVGAGETAMYKLGKVERGDLTAVVAATGTLNPVVSVQVGSQVSGQLRDVLADFNSPVTANQVIARLDPQTFQQKLRQAEADLEATQAAVAVQRAEVARARAQLADAERTLARKKLLVEKQFISVAEQETAQSNYDAVFAAFQVSEAQARSSAAVVKQREAQLAQARIDLGRTEIRSPVDGIVVKRSIEPGQTVAASLQSPELFIIARNLTDMRVETAVDEADVGRIVPGQKATFTVDAFPGRRFEGEVQQVRKAATIVSNVVSYTVVITTSNPDLILLPGMTANVRIITARKEGVLKVPNAALRFKLLDAAKPATAVPPAPTSGKRAGGIPRVWRLTEGKPVEVAIKTGISDGSATELLSDELKEGDELITGQSGEKPKATGFGPRLF